MFKSEDTRRGTYSPLLAAAMAQPAASIAQAAESTSQPAAAIAQVPTDQCPVPPLPEQSPVVAQSEFDEFKDTVRLFVASDRQISQLSAQLKQLRADNVSRREAICKFMGDRDIEDLHTRDMRLKLKTAQVKPPLKKAELHERVATFLGGEDKAADFFEKVYNDRESVEKTSLRRLKVKGV